MILVSTDFAQVFSHIDLRDVMSLVASLQKTGNEVTEEVQVLLWESFFQLLEATK